MKDADFQNLLQGVRELAEAREGHLPKGTHSDHLAEDDVAVVRARLGFSQSQFAKVLGISVNTLQNWEQKRRRPTGPARVLIRMASKHPDALLEAVA
jgi:putative transcriptional regulator